MDLRFTRASSSGVQSVRSVSQRLQVRCDATRDEIDRKNRAALEASYKLQTSNSRYQAQTGKDSKGQQIRMRSLDAAPAGDTQQALRPVDSNRNGGATVSFEQDNSQPKVRSNGVYKRPKISGQNDRLVQQSRLDNSALSTPVVDALPAQLASDLATDAGSREFVMDSEFKWARDDYNNVERSIQIWSFIIQLRSQLFLMEQKWSYFGGFTEERKSKRMRGLAAWCLDKVLQLGPTFIKLGQLFSTRSDLFPVEFTEELSKLQDRVPAFSSQKAISIVEEELGGSVSVLFRSFDRRPIAAASLGQVHRATLHSGEEVVVKVQRPGLRRLFGIDLANMEKLATILDKTDPNRDCTGIYNECRTILFQEVDYINEGKNADRFRRNFQEHSWVKIPKVSWQFTSPSVITLEYLPGIKISDVQTMKGSGLDVKNIANKSTEAYIIQVLNHGFLHSDPHSGNLAVSQSGQLIWYDFGMMSEIAPYTKDRLLEMFYAIAQQDADAVIKSLTSLGIIVPTSDTLSLKRAIAFFLENINKQAEKQETLSAIVDQPFRFPAAFTFVLRAFSTLEGIGKLLVGADEYSFAAIAQPYAQELLDKEAARTYTLQKIGKQASEYSAAAAQMPLKVSKIEDFAKSLEQGSLKLRVRDSATERAMRRSSIMQMTTVQAIAVGGLLNVGTQFQLAGKSYESYPAFGGAAVLTGLILWAFRRIRKLDNFEKQIKSGGTFVQ